MAAQIGKYQLVAEIARGGMGVVYLAAAHGPAGFSKLLVIKELKPEFVEDHTFLAMFLEEARLAARLNHPNIVQTYEVGQDGPRPYIVMDYLDGVTLSRVIRKGSPAFTRDLQIRILCEILQGLAYAHTLKDFDGTPLGIVHRDVTPQNVFVTFDGQAKLVDFGIAKALDSNIETRTGILKGKPAYMAPEQITGEVDPRSDVFSAGVLVWEAVAGHRMWAKSNDVEVLARMLRGELPNLREVAPDAPEALVAITARALASSPDARFQSAAELHDALEAYLATQPPVSMREVGRVVGEIFATERERTRAVIDAHIARLRSGGYVSERVPTLVAPSEKELPPSSTTPASKTQASPGAAPPPQSGMTRTMPFAIPQSAKAPVIPTSGAPVSGTPAGQVAPAPPPPKRSRVVAIVGFGVAAAALGVLGYRIGSGHHVSAEPAPARAPAVASVGAAAKNTVSVPEAPPSAGAAPMPAESASAVVATPASVSTEPPANHARTSSMAPRTRSVATPATTPATRAPESDRTGYLTLDTYPWTRVTLGGKVLGDTPLVRVPLAPGTHVLTLENAGEKLKTTTTVVVKPGESVSKRLAL